MSVLRVASTTQLWVGPIKAKKDSDIKAPWSPWSLDFFFGPPRDKASRASRCNTSRRHWLTPLLAILGIWGATCVASFVWTSFETPFPQSQRVLFATAHPDDETIFFSPTISSLRSAGKEVFLMCLSTGNAYGLGETRTIELQKAAAVLGIDADHLILMDHPELQDGKQSQWSTAAIGQLLTEMQQKHNIDTVVTFDDAGITQHPNHLAVHAGVRDWVAQCEAAGRGGCAAAWELVTVGKEGEAGGRRMAPGGGSSSHRLPPRRRGGGSGDGAAAAAGYYNRDVLRTLRAMAAHRSQSKWWRHLLTKRYTVVNQYARIDGKAAAAADAAAAAAAAETAAAVPVAGDQPAGVAAGDRGSAGAAGGEPSAADPVPAGAADAAPSEHHQHPQQQQEVQQ